MSQIPSAIAAPSVTSVLSVPSASPRSTTRTAPSVSRCIPRHIAIVPEPVTAHTIELWLSGLAAAIEGCRAAGVETLSIQVSGKIATPADEQLHQRLAAWLNANMAGFA